MMDLIDRLFELPPRQRVMFLVGGMAVLFFLYAYFLFWPRSAEIAEKEQQVEQLSTERARKTALVANLAKTREEVARLDGDLKRAIAELPDTKEIPDLLSTISSLAREAGLEIIQFKQRPEQYEEFYAAVPVDILVRGTYHQVASFFDQVGRMARIVNVTDVSIKSPQRPQGDS